MDWHRLHVGDDAAFVWGRCRQPCDEPVAMPCRLPPFQTVISTTQLGAATTMSYPFPVATF